MRYPVAPRAPVFDVVASVYHMEGERERDARSAEGHIDNLLASNGLHADEVAEGKFCKEED